jgi:ParB family chromosome partitioning protein
MKTSPSKITLSPSQDIPFNKLILSQANVRRIKAGISVEDLAEDIARRGLLQGLSVRAVRDPDGTETGMYEIPAGGRRYRALEVLVKQKRMTKTQAVPCVVRTEGLAEEDSLAENVQRVALHPLDQFRAFQTLRDQGLGEEDIAARFFVSPNVVKQRLKLAAVSPRLLDLYAEDAMTLEQLMAFAVTDDHARQEQVWDGLAHAYNKDPWSIRRQLTEGAFRASDKRAQFVGLDAYEAAGGVITRDLFEDDEGGLLQDPALLDRLVAAKLAREAEALRGEGWKWIAAAADFPFGHASGLRRLAGDTPPLSDDEQAACDALRAEYDKLQETWASADELPEEVDARLGEIETALDAFDERPALYDPAAMANAGVFLSIDADGNLRVERGYVRPEDAAACAAEPDGEPGEDGDPRFCGDPAVPRTVITVGGTDSETDEPGAEEDGIKPLPERLVTELTAYRTLALREALANDPDTAFVAALHALCLAAIYRYGTHTRSKS